MKTLFVILIFGFLLAGCENKTGKVEVVPNLEAIYTSVNDVDTSPKEIKENGEGIDSTITDAVKSLYNKNSGKLMRFRVALRIYMNEKGRIDKIKDIISQADLLKSKTDSVDNYTDREKLTKTIAEEVSRLKFEPAKINGSPVKCRSDIKVNVLIYPDGQAKAELPDFLTNIHPFNSNDTYYVAVDEMPEPIGGIAAIQKNIKYPEIAKRAGIEGKVYIQAYIDENGNVTKTTVLKGIGAGCDEAAINAIKKVKFKPGRQRGVPVKVQVSVPVVFKLSDETSSEDKFFNQAKIKSESRNKLFSEINQKAKYPEKALVNKIEGRVLVKALLDKQGNVIKTQIVGKTLGYGLDEAAQKAVKSTRIPIEYAGVPFYVLDNNNKISEKYTPGNREVIMPVTFKLNKKQEKK